MDKPSRAAGWLVFLSSVLLILIQEVFQWISGISAKQRPFIPDETRMQTTTALNATGFVTSHPLPIVLWRFSEEEKKISVNLI